MFYKIAFAVLACVFLAGCDVKQRAIPELGDEQGAVRILHELSPWADGSPDRSNDGKTPGEPMSDRQLFGTWFMEASLYETYAQHDRDYQPRAIPASVGAAIEEQRMRELAKQRGEVAYTPSSDTDAERWIREENQRLDREINDRLREQEQRQARQDSEQAERRWSEGSWNAAAQDDPRPAATNGIDTDGGSVGDGNVTAADDAILPN